ncbi:MAG TPA: biotin--[acetyl-CoA-carboxylase] ligase [Steroidobacteraceae bacterium]|nr:biotin--[acetyl-CoA-carboxylase] ligase [Steroidobacteraceae bacterium]
MAVSLPRRVDRAALVGLLADGEVRSGASLARALETNRREVGEAIGRLRDQGVDIAAVPRRGYRLANPVELLSQERIRAALGGEGRRRLHRLEVLFEVDSTNTRLLHSPRPPWGQADACLAELQHAGRGRHGRRWISPFGAAIALSIGWGFRDSGFPSPALSLASAVAVSRALKRVGAQGIRLKWPNDIWFDDRKVGGILLELTAVEGAAAHVVIGVGLNLKLSAAERYEIEASGARVAALADAGVAAVSRNALSAALLEALFGMLAEFERDGFGPFRAEWEALDALAARPARILSAGDGAILGLSRGVDKEGALLLEVGDGRLQRFVSGEVSLRGVEA